MPPPSPVTALACCLVCAPVAPFAAAAPATVAPEAAAARASRSPLLPDSVSIQSAGGEGTDSLSLGLQWAPGPVWRPAPGLLLEGQLEFAMGRWRARGADGVRSWAWVSQFSLVPVLRLRGVDTTGPYAEIGIGPSYLTPVYRSRDKRFSSRFQFRDHLAVGWTWGAGARHDLSVRIEHFSNGGLDEPNPGINLVGVRYTWRF